MTRAALAAAAIAAAVTLTACGGNCYPHETRQGYAVVARILTPRCVPDPGWTCAMNMDGFCRTIDGPPTRVGK